MNRARKIELEKLALDILSKHNIRDNPGKHLKEITDAEGITVLAYKGWDPQVCGKIILIDNAPAIFYNEEHTERMISFTIAHELGHYFLGHLDEQTVEIICLDRDFQRMEEKTDKREVEANYFASCLLLPLNLLKPEFDAFMEWNRIYNGVLYVDKQPCNFHNYKMCIQKMQLCFLASETAIRYRLINLGWMIFNIEFDDKEDKGISLARYLEAQKS